MSAELALLEKVPAHARRILARLEARVDAHRGVRAADHERIEALNEKIRIENHNIFVLENERWSDRDSAKARENAAKHLKARREHLAFLQAELGKAKAAQVEHSNAARPAITAFGIANGILREGVALRPCFASPAAVAWGKSFGSVIAKQRREIEAINAEIEATGKAPLPAKVAKKSAREQIDSLAKLGEPDVRGLFRGERISWPHTTFVPSIFTSEGVGTGSIDIPNPLSMLAWLFRDALIRLIEDRIDAEARDDIAMTVEAREAKIAELKAKLLAAERVECATTFAAWDAGEIIEFRENTDPRALLAVE